MTSPLKLFALGLGLSALSIGCNRENEEEPMTPANATGQPRQVPDSRHDDNDSNGNPRSPNGSMSRQSEPYPDPFTTPADWMRAPGTGGGASHDGTASPSKSGPQ